MRKLVLKTAVLSILVSLAGTTAVNAQTNDVDMTALMLGRWPVEKANFLLGESGNPVTSEGVITERAMIGDGRFVSATKAPIRVNHARATGTGSPKTRIFAMIVVSVIRRQ